jgi:diguanylate cyclase (GGDEF)-like protein
MNRLNYPQKLFVIGLLFVIPIVMLTAWIMEDIGDRIEHAKIQRTGLQYHSALHHTVNDVLQLRNTYILQVQQDPAKSKQDRDQLFKSLLANKTSVDLLDRQLEHSLPMINRWSSIQSLLLELEQKADSIARLDAVSLYNQAINDIYALMRHVADLSSIRVLADKQGSLYGNVVVDRLPDSLAQLDSIMNIGINTSFSQTIMLEQKMRLTRIMESVRLNANLLEEQGAMLAAGSENTESIAHYIETFKDDVTKFNHLLEGLLSFTSKTPFTPMEAYIAGSAAVLTENQFYDSMVPLLNQKLVEQSNYYEALQRWIAVFLVGVLLLISFIFSGFYLSVMQTVTELQRTSQRIAAGDLSARVHLDTKDELKTIETAYNVMAEVFDRLMSEKAEEEESIKLKAYYDALTGLPNRFLLEDRLRTAISHAQRSKTMIGVLFIDLDGFKQINDTLGHQTGDKLLQSMSARLTSCLRESDTVSRVGGDEFLVLLTDLTENEHALHVANKLVRVLQNTYIIGGHQVEVSASIGVSMYPRDGTDWEILVQKADSAMYNVKTGGKNGALLSSDLPVMPLEHREQLEEELANGITHGEFVVFYQPIFNLRTGYISGMEAFIRWNHPTRGLLLPGDFLNSAQDNGWIIQLDEYILNEVCRQNKSWQVEEGLFIPVAVNLYLHPGWKERLEPTITAILDSVGLSPQYLEIEITEDRIFQNLDVILPELDKLRDAGIRVMLDDFGTELSSYNQLKRLPIHGIKIDRTFVKDVPQGRKDRAITSSIVTLARELQLKVVAEGVETVEQYDFLKKLEYGDAQGYYFSTPLTASSMTELISLGKISIHRQAYL